MILNTEGHNNVKKQGELQFLFSAYHVIMLDTCTKFHENMLNGLRVLDWTRFKKNRQTNRQMDTHCVIIPYIYTKFHENILSGFKIIEQTRFPY